MLIRFGVSVPPRKAELIDFIADCTTGRGGVPLGQIVVVFYGRLDRKKAIDAVRNHICQINGLLCETDWRIVNRAGLYRIEEHPSGE